MNRVQHFLIPADDVERAKEFYEKHFGWKIKQSDGLKDRYHFVDATPADDQSKSPEAIDGGLFQRGSHGLDHVSIVIEVSSIDDCLKELDEEGLEITLPKTAVRGAGFYAQFKDTEGNGIGLWEESPAT